MIKELEKIYISTKWLSNLRTKDDFTKDVEDVIKLLNGKRVGKKQIKISDIWKQPTALPIYNSIIDEIKKIKLAKGSKFTDPLDTDDADFEYKIGRDIKLGRKRLCIFANRFLSLNFLEENLLVTKNWLAEENTSKEKLVELRQLWERVLVETGTEKGKNISNILTEYDKINTRTYQNLITELINELQTEIAKKSDAGIEDKIKEVELEIENWKKEGFKNIEVRIQARGVAVNHWLDTTDWKTEARRRMAGGGISAKEAIEESVGLPLSEAISEWLIDEKKFEKFNHFQETSFWMEATFLPDDAWNRALKKKYNDLERMNTDDKVVEEVSKVKQFIKIDEINKYVIEKRTYFASSDANNFDPDPLYWENLKDGLDSDSAKELVDEVKDLGDKLVESDERIYQILEVLKYNEKYPDFAGYEDDSGEIFYWTQLEKTLQRNARDDGSQRNLEDLINIIVNVKKHLGLSDAELDNLISVADLAMPTKKTNGVEARLTLKELIRAYNGISGGVAELERVKKELAEQKENCATEKQQWEETTKQKLTEKEAEILGYLNDNLKLLLGKSDISKESVLNKIQKLIAAKPPSVPNKQRENELEREITKLKAEIAQLKNRDNFITKETIIRKSEKIFHELGISSVALKADNIPTEQVEEIRDNLIKSEFDKIKNGKSNAKNLNIILVILLICALIALVIKGVNSAKIGAKK